MKQVAIIFVSILILVAVGCQPGNSGSPGNTGEEMLKLDTEKKKTGYSIGYDMGKNASGFSEEIDISALLQGVRDGITQTENIKLPVKERKDALRKFNQKIKRIQQERRVAVSKKNEAEGKPFLEKNAKKEGIITTKSGLQYKVIKQGTGPIPKATDKVKVHYKGMLINGIEFDTSYKRGKPVIFELNKVIPGWIEGLQLMKVGSIYKFVIPANLAWGERGSGRMIGPNAVVIFEVELLEILKGEEQKETEKKE